MKGVTFGNYHSYDDFSLILSSKEIGIPKPKKMEVDISGADGVLDFTDYFGEVKFDNRQLTFNFSTATSPERFFELFSDIQNALQGEKMKIVVDDDPDYYYVGRVNMDKWKVDNTIGKITIECNCEPYKYKLYNTVINVPVTGKKTVVCPNLRKAVVPTITVSAAVQIEFNNNTYALSSAGTFEVPEIEFKAGNNLLTISGNANVKIEYREGGL